MSMLSLLRCLQFVQLSFPAPPLTLDNVLNVVKNVREMAEGHEAGRSSSSGKTIIESVDSISRDGPDCPYM